MVPVSVEHGISLIEEIPPEVALGTWSAVATPYVGWDPSFPV